MRKLLLILLGFVCGNCSAQCVPTSSNCLIAPGSQIVMSTPATVNFTFDNFSSYVGGITYSGATILRIKTQNNPGDTCHWKLRMYIHTNDVSGTDWHGTAYGPGAAGTKPKLDLISIRVYNYCGTAYRNMVLQNFHNINDDFIDIIDDVSLHYPGNCNGSSVNTAGSYLTNYGEYSFNIDYVIKPGVGYIPGYYDISVKFCLTE